MSGMKHSKTMSRKHKDNMTGFPKRGGAGPKDKSHRNYTQAKRSGGPFGK